MLLFESLEVRIFENSYSPNLRAHFRYWLRRRVSPPRRPLLQLPITFVLYPPARFGLERLVLAISVPWISATSFQSSTARDNCCSSALTTRSCHSLGLKRSLLAWSLPRRHTAERALPANSIRAAILTAIDSQIVCRNAAWVDSAAAHMARCYRNVGFFLYA